MPKKNNNLKPMLAQEGSDQDLERKDYIFEPKLDGFRALCSVNTTITLHSRTGRIITSQFPELNFRKQINAKECVLDGEIVVYNKKGNPDFNLLQGRDQNTQKQLIDSRAEHYPATFVVFDIIEKNGKSLCNFSLLERKKILNATVKDGNGIEVIPYTAEGKKLWQLMKKRRLEGVMAKDKSSLYYPEKRTYQWLKIKFSHTIDCVIIGYTQAQRLISALALGVYHKGTLIYLSKVGTGFSQQEIKLLHAKLFELKTDKSPVSNCPFTNIIWVKPHLICEIKYSEITKDTRLRKPVFLRLRTDKLPKDCIL